MITLMNKDSLAWMTATWITAHLIIWNSPTMNNSLTVIGDPPRLRYLIALIQWYHPTHSIWKLSFQTVHLLLLISPVIQEMPAPSYHLHMIEMNPLVSVLHIFKLSTTM